MKERMRNTKGITLIALVITIVILIILAGVTIASLTGDSSIIKEARTAKELSEKAALEELVDLAILEAEKKHKDPTLKDVIEELKIKEVIQNEDQVNKETGDIRTDAGYEIIGKLDDYIGKVSVGGEDKEEPETDGSWTGEVNSPKLGEMTAVYWDESNNEIEGDTGEKWYKYIAGDNSTDTRTSHWANAKNNGSYFVWIPRYEYKILSGEGTNTAGKIEVKFIPTSQTTPDEGYKIHPAFQNGSSNNFKNGEWDSELSGIWVAKYEPSHSDATASTVGSSTTIKIIPGVQSWRSISVGDCYTNAYNYDRSKESHLMKNSEWGAVAYLTHSQYGRNGHEIDINNSSSYITGSGGGSPSAVAGVSNAYNTEKGIKASTTGNIYGIYDLSGGAWEYVASYMTNGSSYLSEGSSFVAKTIADGEGYNTLSTKYATVYPYDTANDKNVNNYTVYKNLGYGYGDGILETSKSGTDKTSWFSDFSGFMYQNGAFFVRGADYRHNINAGVFCYYALVGSAGELNSFRLVLTN